MACPARASSATPPTRLPAPMMSDSFAVLARQFRNGSRPCTRLQLPLIVFVQPLWLLYAVLVSTLVQPLRRFPFLFSSKRSLRPRLGPLARVLSASSCSHVICCPSCCFLLPSMSNYNRLSYCPCYSLAPFTVSAFSLFCSSFFLRQTFKHAILPWFWVGFLHQVASLFFL